MPRDWLARLGRKERLIAVLKFVVVAAALAYLIVGDRLRLGELVVRADGIAWLALAWALIFVAFGVGIARFWVLLRGLGFQVSLRYASRIWLIGMFFNSFLLGNVGGEAVKFYYLARDSDNRSSVFACLLSDRLFGLAALVLIAGAAILWQFDAMMANPELRMFVFAVSGLALIGLAAIAVVAYVTRESAVRVVAAEGTKTHKVRAAWDELRLALRSYRDTPQTLVAAVALSIGLQLLVLLALWSLGMSLPVANPPTLDQTLMAAPFALISRVVPMPLGGIGISESVYDAMLAFFAGEGAAIRGGAAIFLWLRVVLFSLGLLGLPGYLSHRDEIEKVRSGEIRVPPVSR